MISFLNKPENDIKALGLGVFDGLHLGHQQIASRCSHLLTFTPNPAIVLKKIQSIQTLSSFRELRYIYPEIIALKFTKRISQLSPEDFLDDVIYKHLSPKKIVVGYDYHFGAQKQGDYAFIKQWAKHYKIDVEQVSMYTKFREPVKSSLIRKHLTQDQFDLAKQLLGHDYIMIGKVKKGEGRGRKLGFPTANLHLPRSKCLPTSGVYMGWADWKKKLRPAMIYIGEKPTFGKHSVGVEVHIPNFEDDLYGHYLPVLIDQKIRNQLQFNSTDDLVSQINRDLSWLKELKPGF